MTPATFSKSHASNALGGFKHYHRVLEYISAQIEARVLSPALMNSSPLISMCFRREVTDTQPPASSPSRWQALHTTNAAQFRRVAQMLRLDAQNLLLDARELVHEKYRTMSLPENADSIKVAKKFLLDGRAILRHWYKSDGDMHTLVHKRGVLWKRRRGDEPGDMPEKKRQATDSEVGRVDAHDQTLRERYC